MRNIIKLSIIFLISLFCVIATNPVIAMEDFRPAIIYESSGDAGDKAFIDSMLKGANRAKEEVGIEYEEFKLPANTKRIDFIKKVAESGVTHIIAVGFQNVVPISSIADEFQEVKFTVIDGMVPPLFANVQSVNFKDHEGSFLVGMIAGYKTKTNKVGFIGGMDVPLINNFSLGFYQGLRYANPDIEMIRDTVGNTVDAWSSPEKAKSLAKKQYNSGVDIIFAAAGGSSIGVLEAAEETGKYAIGVDTNQNSLFPNAVLTSMVKRVDKAIYNTLTNAFSGRWEAGIKYLGIREGVLDYAVDIHNKDKISKEVIDKVEDAKDRIIRGQIQVEIYVPY